MSHPPQGLISSGNAGSLLNYITAWESEREDLGLRPETGNYGNKTPLDYVRGDGIIEQRAPWWLQLMLTYKSFVACLELSESRTHSLASYVK